MISAFTFLITCVTPKRVVQQTNAVGIYLEEKQAVWVLGLWGPNKAHKQKLG